MFWKKSDEAVLKEDYMFVFKDSAIDTIKRAKGWKTDAEMAKRLDFTRQYICALKKHRLPVTHEVIIRVATALGDTKAKWWNHFEIVPSGKYRPDHPKYNQAKYEGKKPYAEHSISAEFRKLDTEVEQRSDVL